VSVHHGSGSADAESVALKQNSERGDTCFRIWVSKGRRKHKRHRGISVRGLKRVVPLSSENKLETARRTMVKRKMHRNAESASAGELGRELR
jgi:hypothetical protein